ncbi:MAG: hypothetical protein Q8O55_00385 [Dehalococcoidales bacterium]|nr:hypothetical protein [Dehalococcoidales bacterium]
MVTNATTQERKPVYIAFKTFLSALAKLEQGVPPVIDRYVWSSFSGSLQAQTLSAFKFLGLIDEKGNSQPILQKLIDAKGDAKKTVLRELLEAKYAEAVKLGESNASFQQLQDALRAYGISGGTLEMAVRFFTDACSFTGLRCSPHWATAKKSRRSRDKKDIPPINKGEGKPKPPIGDKSKPPDESLQLHPMLLGLIKELPTPGSVLEKQKRDSLEKYFGVVLDILYQKSENDVKQ